MHIRQTRGAVKTMCNNVSLLFPVYDVNIHEICVRKVNDVCHLVLIVQSALSDLPCDLPCAASLAGIQPVML